MKNYLNFPHNKEKILRIHQGTNNCNWEYREFVDCRHKVFNCILAFNGNDRGMKVCILRLLPFPFTGPKTFCAGPNFLSQPKSLTAFSASSSSGYGQRPKFVRDKNSATAEGENFGPTLFFSGTSIN